MAKRHPPLPPLNEGGEDDHLNEGGEDDHLNEGGEDDHPSPLMRVPPLR